MAFTRERTGAGRHIAKRIELAGLGLTLTEKMFTWKRGPGHQLLTLRAPLPTGLRASACGRPRNRRTPTPAVFVWPTNFASTVASYWTNHTYWLRALLVYSPAPVTKFKYREYPPGPRLPYWSQLQSSSCGLRESDV